MLKLWTSAVGGHGYDKSAWKFLDKLLFTDEPVPDPGEELCASCNKPRYPHRMRHRFVPRG